MDIDRYTDEVRHAVSVIVAEIHREQGQQAELQQQLVVLTAATADGYRRVEFLTLNPDLDDDGLGTAIHWDTYFGVDKERFARDAELQAMAERVKAHEFSVAALAGNLLQYAKQGIALRFGKRRDGCPNGRLIAGLPLHEVIWHALGGGAF
jgi:hypothetical protein